MASELDDPTAIPVQLADIHAAARRLEPWVHRTPVMTSRTLDERAGRTVFLKCENLQRVGAFKFRGAMNALLQLDESRASRGRGHAFLGQPRPGAGPGRAVARRPGDDRHAPHGPGGEAGRDRRLRRPDRPLRADPGITRGDRRRPRSSGTGSRSFIRSTTGRSSPARGPPRWSCWNRPARSTS